MRRAAGAAAALALLTGVGWTCGSGSRDQGRGGPIDEHAASYRGIAIGATAADIRRAFGEPGSGEGFFPLDESFGEIGGAPAVVNWPRDWRGRPTVLRYESVAFLVGPEGLFAFVVTERGARTRRGVAIGDPLAKAVRAYGLGCIDQPYGEPLFGGDVPTFRTCRGTVDRRIRIWFGRDPIRSITLARVAR
jgi:hypothetical protein